MKIAWLILTTLATLIGFVVMACLFVSVCVTLATFGGWGIFWLPAGMLAVALSMYLRNRPTR